MRWNDSIHELWSRHGKPTTYSYDLSHPYNADLAMMLFRLFRDGTYEDEADLAEAVRSTWIELASPTSSIAGSVWREMFEATGQIEYGRHLPTKHVTAYRYAPTEFAKAGRGRSTREPS